MAISLVHKLLFQQLMFDKKAKQHRTENGTDSLEIDINLIDIVADMIGVPSDNTNEFDTCSAEEWPEGCYCRDWLLHEWDDVVDGKITVDDFIAEMRKERQPVYESWFWSYYESHLDFVRECFEAGIKPTHFVDVLIQAQRDFNNKEKYAESIAKRLNKKKKDREDEENSR